MEKLIEIAKLGMILGSVIAVGLQTVKGRLQSFDIELKGNTWFIIAIIVSGVITGGFGYYLELPFDIMVGAAGMAFLGSQAIYDILIDRKGGE